MICFQAFSPDDEYTIIPKDSRFLSVIGNREHLSFRDIKIINVMYKCGGMGQEERGLPSFNCEKASSVCTTE